MKAAVIEAHGMPPRYGEHPDPVCTDGQALVRMTAAPITPLDLLCASGSSYWGAPALPYVPGVQGIGEVVTGQTRATGDLVWFPTTAGMVPGDGSMAELVAVDEAATIALPAGLSSAAAGSLGLSSVAALLALTDTGRLVAGECVVVLGAGGAVGQSALQLARHLGAGRVVGVVHSSGSADRARAKEPDAVVDASATNGPDGLADRLREACDGGADLVIDPVFGHFAEAAIAVLRPGGRLVQLGSAGGETARLDSATIRSRRLAILGYTNATLSADQTAAALTITFGLGAQGLLTVEHEQRPIVEVEAAWARQLAGQAPRRIILTND